MDEAFVKLLKCPKTGQALRWDGAGFLVTADGKIRYPLVDGIPQLLVEDGRIGDE